MQEKILKLLEENARLSNRQIAVMLDMTEDAVAAAIAEYEKNGVIKGYQAVVDWDSSAPGHVTAMIELKVAPRRDSGFDELAHRVMEYEEVESVYLMSGGYDLLVCVHGSSLLDVAMFVAKRLSTLDGVLSTATHFLLNKYKENGFDLTGKQKDKRSMIL